MKVVELAEEIGVVELAEEIGDVMGLLSGRLCYLNHEIDRKSMVLWACATRPGMVRRNRAFLYLAQPMRDGNLASQALAPLEARS